MNKLIIFDVDNTIVKGQSQQILLSYLYKNKKISLRYYMFVSIWFILYKLHLVNDPRSIVSFAYSFLKGKSEEEIDLMMSKFFDNCLKQYIFPDAENELRTIMDLGSSVVLLSNAPSIIIKPLADYLKVSIYISTQLEIKAGKYTGNIVGDIIYGENKLNAIQGYARKFDFTLIESTAYCDHISDLPVLKSVGHPVVINPALSLNKIAVNNHWEIHNWNL